MGKRSRLRAYETSSVIGVDFFDLEKRKEVSPVVFKKMQFRGRYDHDLDPKIAPETISQIFQPREGPQFLQIPSCVLPKHWNATRPITSLVTAETPRSGNLLGSCPRMQTTSNYMWLRDRSGIQRSIKENVAHGSGVQS